MPDTPLIPPDQHWPLLALLVLAGAAGLWAERTRWGARLSGVVVAMGAAFLLSNLSIIPPDAPVYGVVWSYLVPLAIPLLLFRADLRRILKEAGATLVAYALGAAGTVLGTVVAFHTVPLGAHGWQIAAIFSATYIGGSMNYLSASQAVGLEDRALLTAGVAADNLVMAFFFLLLLTLPTLAWLRRLYPVRRTSALPDLVTAAVEGAEATADGAAPPTAEAPEPPLGVTALATAMALATGVCAVGFSLERLLGVKGSGILILTALMVALATLAPGPLARLAPAERVGMFLMQVFFATLGASANIGVVLRQGAALFLFAAVILTVHLVVLLGLGRLLRLDLAELVIASNANLGGPTTAAAMAVARGWRTLVVPAILCGTLGYAVATFLGVALGYALR